MPEPRCDVRLLVLGASLGSQSLNNRLAALTARLAEEKGARVDRAHMKDFSCPLYDSDLETESGVPAGAQAFADRLKAADAMVLSSPEYNGSMPAAIKNLIDWASRLRPQPFNGKQAFLLSASPSMVGGNRGLWALRVPLEHLGMRVYPDMFSLAQAHQAFNEEGGLVKGTLQERLGSTLGCFMGLVEAAKNYGGLKKRWIEFLGEHPDPATAREETATLDGA